MFKKYIYNIQAPSKKFAAYSSSYPNLKRASYKKKIFCLKNKKNTLTLLISNPSPTKLLTFSSYLFLDA